MNQRTSTKRHKSQKEKFEHWNILWSTKRIQRLRKIDCCYDKHSFCSSSKIQFLVKVEMKHEAEETKKKRNVWNIKITSFHDVWQTQEIYRWYLYSATKRRHNLLSFKSSFRIRKVTKNEIYQRKIISHSKEDDDLDARQHEREFCESFNNFFFIFYQNVNMNLLFSLVNNIVRRSKFHCWTLQPNKRLPLITFDVLRNLRANGDKNALEPSKKWTRLPKRHRRCLVIWKTKQMQFQRVDNELKYMRY